MSDGTVVYLGDPVPGAVAEIPLEVRSVTDRSDLDSQGDCILYGSDHPVDVTMAELRLLRESVPILAIVEPDDCIAELLAAGATEYIHRETLELENATRLVTNRIRTLLRQRDLEERATIYEEMIEAAPDPFFALGPDGCFVEVNESAATMSGYDESELLGTHAMETVTEEGREKALGVIQSLRTEDADRKLIEFELERSDGSTVPVEGHFGLRRPGTEGYHGLVGMLRDLSDRKERERELEMYEEMIQSIPDTVYASDEDGRFDHVNRAGLDALGYDYDEIVGMKARTCVVPEDRDKIFDAVKTLFTTDLETVMLEYEALTNDGERFPVEQHMALRASEDGEFRGTVGMLRDVTERKRREERLERQSRHLELLNRVLRHDVRNDMQYIVLMGDALKEEVDDGETRDVLETLVDNAEHAVELTKTVRDLVEVVTANGEQPLEPQRLDRTVMDELEAVSESTEVRVDAEPVPPVRVEADDMLGSVFRNLFQNAVEHNDEGVPELEISVRESAEEVILQIADDGPGIPEEVRSDLFGRNERGLQSDGTGVGLYLVDTLVDRYGGEIDLLETDDGATFELRLRKFDRES